MADKSGKTEREQRLAQALRSNLRRRKAARAPAQEAGGAAEPGRRDR